MEDRGDEIDQMAREESVVLSARTFGSSRELHEHDAACREATVEGVDRKGRHLRFDHRAPPVQATCAVFERDGIDASEGTVDQLRDDP